MRLHALVLGGVFALEITFGAYVAAMVLASMTWSVDGGSAAAFSQAQWMWVALRRLILGLILAVVVGGAGWAINRELADGAAPRWQRIGRNVAFGMGGLIAASAIGGALWFMLAHPTP